MSAEPLEFSLVTNASAAAGVAGVGARACGQKNLLVRFAP